MSSLRSNTARILLDRVSPDNRAQVVQDVTKSLNDQSGLADIGFAAALLELHSDEDAKNTLLDHLLALIQQGQSNDVVSICSHHPALQSTVLTNVVKIISEQVESFRKQSENSTGLRAGATNGRRLSSAAHESAATSPNESTARLLNFVSKAVNSTFPEGLLDEVLTASLTFLGSSERIISTSSRDVLFALFSLPKALLSPQTDLIWSTIQDLVGSNEALHKTMGFSVWLRWILSSADQDCAILRQQKYWDLIKEGLQYGDAERRKACLQVLRASVDISTQDPKALSLLVTGNCNDATPEAIQKQYSRYCTIFETIVLGRYLNQVQECEADLDFLSSSSSIIKPVWLYTLLSSALEQKMQDSNRKFVGKWILRSQMRTDDLDGFLHFFRYALLPWATSGNLFTSTLRKIGSALRCEHGEILSDYVANLLKTKLDLTCGVIDSILDSILSRHGNNFAYAMAYLVEGIRMAFESTSSLNITHEQLEKIGKIPTWAGLPEVARDLILATSWKMCDTYIRRNPGNSSQEIALGASNWKKLDDKVSELRPKASAHVDGNIASLALEQSRRDKFEQNTIQKCVGLMKELDTAKTSEESVKYAETIEDIWSDLEYLEYPKSLLAVLPSLIPHQKLVEIAFEKHDTDATLATILATKTSDLLELSKSRSYLLSPLTISVREVALHKPEASELFRLEDFIVGLAEQPPTPTIDAQLEDAMVSILQNLDPSLSRLNYEYYFGPREGQGFAALLDIVSRLGALATNLHKVILDRFLERWMRQKTPPPTVSPWKTTLQLQIMLLCSDQYLSQTGTEEADQLLKKFHYMLAVEPLPRYRYLFEWMIARTYIHHLSLRRHIFDELRTKDHHSNPKFLASLMKLGVTMAKIESSDENFAQELANVFVPLAASSKVVIRHEAQWQIPVLMDHAKSKGWTSVSESIAFVELDSFIRSLSHFDDPPLERQIDKFDPINDHNLTHLVEGRWYCLDNVEQPQTSHEDFLNLYVLNDETKSNRPRPCMPLGPPINSFSQPQATETTPNHDRKILQNIDNISRALGSGPGPAALQTKGNAYLESARTRHDNLLVIASLVDNPYNLGGLSRVSEIFGAGAMYLQNLHVTSNKDFTNVSVSSHMHLPILPLSASGVAEFVAEKKRNEGFQVVGIEQTDRSVLVGSEGCLLPEKCILVIGSEREGIPAVLLGECDLLVEIPQVGITRSLNVQTAAAIVLCEYAKQWKK